MKYDFASIEEKWQKQWEAQGTFVAPNPGQPGFDPQQPKFYVLDMFPYPSGVGLHVGHPLGYIATDIVARYKRMAGFNVLHPMGYDAFGLPAEQYAVEKGVHPAITTAQNIANMTRQLRRLGLSYDWQRSISTTDAEYYRWTQWIFLQIFHSWFDPIQKKARPISDLIQLMESGQAYVGLDGEMVWAGAEEGLDAVSGRTVGLRAWHELSQSEREGFINEQRLAFLDESPVNWCPMLGTVLANEEVTADGKSERGNHTVYRRPLKQWMLRITAYAERLAEDLDLVDWPEPIKLMQRNWIGRSEGAYVDFQLASTGKSTSTNNASGNNHGDAGDDETEVIRVFTTRPDTLFGATYMVLAPEHPLVDAITSSDQYHAVHEYQKQTASKADVDRIADTKTKTGVFTGAFAINPVNGQRIPIWIADYVLMGYGTGAIMAVPAHDERDFAFARQFSLPIVPVIKGGDEPLTKAYEGDGPHVNSAHGELSINGLPNDDAKRVMTDWLETQGIGERSVQYKLRDWLFSRQRYWGEPFPVLHGPDGEIVAVEESELPVRLPEMTDFKPTSSSDPQAPPQPPLSRAPDSWKFVVKNGVRYTREFNTMPQWAGSCWYYLRFCDPRNGEKLVGAEAEKYWMGNGSKVQGPRSKVEEAKNKLSPGGVDLYVGGVEHAVLHLLYARFWHKVLFDLGHVSTPEPFGRLFNQGYIQAHAYRDQRGMYVEAEKVTVKHGQWWFEDRPVEQEFGKMGKSLKNAIAPDDICAQYGCDTLRLYEMYLGPLDQSKVWNTRDIIGVHRFLQRLWRVMVDENTGALRLGKQAPDMALNRLLHKTIRRVTEAMEAMSYNVAIAALIEFNNELVKRFGGDNSTTGTTGGTDANAGNAGSGVAGDAVASGVPREVMKVMTLLLSPLAPHISEELWERLGHTSSLARETWPVYDPAMLVEDTIEYPVQVNGKLRGKVIVARDADQKTIEAAACADEKVKQAVGDKTIRKVIIVPGKMVNLVIG